jgi:hypothetical protein
LATLFFADSASKFRLDTLTPAASNACLAASTFLTLGVLLHQEGDSEPIQPEITYTLFILVPLSTVLLVESEKARPCAEVFDSGAAGEKLSWLTLLPNFVLTYRVASAFFLPAIPKFKVKLTSEK